jgi:isopentenyl diphosphate isomerase/L-lactate dehydrogenase-like FMN-dependent dehydrogenase
VPRTPYNVEGFRRAARRKLPRTIFDFVDGGAEDETTLRANRQAFAAIRLVPRVLTGAGIPDLSTSVCGQLLAMPLLLAPTGMAGICHPAGELGAAQAANRHGVVAVMSVASTYTIEEVAAATSPPPWYQLSPSGDRAFYTGLMEQAAAAGYPGLCVTVDTAAIGRRERDYANRLVVPPTLENLGPRNVVDFLTRPRWGLDVLRHRRIVMKAFADPGTPRLRTLLASFARATAGFTGQIAPFGWSELEQVRADWSGPLAVKGILSPDDARTAVGLGADAVVVSNHGGRQLDGSLASLEALPAIVEAVGGSAEVILDGGVRRGTDVVKAIALGARACMVGRPWLYGLASGGSEGVVAVLDALRAEIEVAMALLGVDRMADLGVRHLAPVGGLAQRLAPGAPPTASSSRSS